MKFILAESAGFCFGVRRAVDMVLSESAARHGKITTYGPLVHNPQVIELLKLRDIACTDNLAEITAGMAVIRTHGVPPPAIDELAARGLALLDATCPKVRAVQMIVEKQAVAGRTIVIFGEAEHPEVIGLVGAARGRPCFVVRDQAQFDQLRLSPDAAVTLVAQTTANRERYQQLIERVQPRFARLEARQTICNSTELKQQEVRDLATRVQAMLVVGGRNSGNTRRLASITRDLGLPTWQIEVAEELDGIDFTPYDAVGVTAGASTPSWIIDRVMTRLHELEAEQTSPGRARLRRLLDAAAATHATTGLAAGSLAYVGAALMGAPFRFDFFLLVALYVLSMHVLNRVTETGVDKFRDDPKRQTFYRRHLTWLWALGLGSGLASIWLGFHLGVIPFLIVLAASIVGVLYSVRVVPKSWMRFFGFRRLKDLAASKNVFVASAWALVSIFPLFFVNEARDWRRLALAFLFLFMVTGVRSVFLDLSDMASDQLVGRETVPLVIGPQRARALIQISIVGLAVGLFLTAALGWLPSLAWLLGSWILGEFLFLEFVRRPAKMPTLKRDMIVDLHFIVAGGAALLWRWCA